MGTDIHMKVVKFNHEDRYFHELKLFRVDDGEYRPVYIYNGRNSEMFDAMQNKNNYQYGMFPCRGCLKVSSLDPELQKFFEEEMKIVGCYGFNEISLNEFGNYVLTHEKIEDYDVDWEGNETEVVYKDNPLKDLYSAVIHYIDFAEKYGIYKDYDDYKVIFWFDW